MESNSQRPLGLTKLKISGVAALAGSAVLFCVGAVVSPFLGKFGERVAENFMPKKQDVEMIACAPLKEARLIIRQPQPYGSAIIADKSIEYMNETGLYIKNLSGKTIKNGVITIYPLAGAGSKPDILATKMLASSFKGSESYNVSRKEAAYEIKMPAFNDDDILIVLSNFAGPIGYEVEVFGDSFSAKRSFPPGCKNKSLKAGGSMRQFFEYYSPKCKKEGEAFDCKLLANMPLSITADMPGKILSVEEKIDSD